MFFVYLVFGSEWNYCFPKNGNHKVEKVSIVSIFCLRGLFPRSFFVYESGGGGKLLMQFF